MSGNQDNKYTIIECSDNTEESLSFLLKKYVLDIPEEEAEASIKRFQEIEKRNNGVRLVKAVKNPFAKVHQAAVESDGNLPDETRKRMMKEAAHELRNRENCYIGIVKDRLGKTRADIGEQRAEGISSSAKDIIIEHLKDLLGGRDPLAPKEKVMGRKPVPDEQKKRIRSYRRKGWTLKEISELEGVSIGAVSGIRKDIKGKKQQEKPC